MARILRGDIYWADLATGMGHEQAGKRPVVVLSRDVFNESSKTVIAAAITSKVPHVRFPLSLEITSSHLPQNSWVKIGQIRTLSTERLGKRIGEMSSQEVDLVIEGLLEIIGS